MNVVTRFKTPRIRSGQHLAWIRTLPCVVPGCQGKSEPHHLKCGPEGGGTVTASDVWAVPVCRRHHDAAYPDGLHRYGREMDWWNRLGIDPIAYADRLWASSPVNVRLKCSLSCLS